MARKIFLCFSLGFFTITSFFNVTWAQKGARDVLREQFAPSGSFIQMQNVSQYEPYYTDYYVDDEVSPAQADKELSKKEARRVRSDRVRRLEPEKPAVGEYAIYQSQYETKIEEEIGFIKARVNFEVFKKKGWVKIPLASSSVGLKEASLNRKPSFVIREGDKYVLLVDKPGRYTLDLEFFIKVRREREHGPGSLSFWVLPSPISILDVEMDETEVEIFVEPSIRIETEKLAKKTYATAVLPFTERVTVRWSKALPKEIIPAVVLEPKIYVETVTLVSIGDGVAKCTSNLHYSILQSEVSNLRVSFPEDVGILEVSGNQLRDWKIKSQEGSQILDVYLNYGVKGSYTLNLIYERSIGAGSVTAEIPAIHVAATERERGFVGIEARTNIELAFNKLTGASVVDVKELPQQIWTRATNPVLLAFKYLKSPYSAIIDVTKHTEVPVLVAAIDSSSYVTLSTEEGKILTKATYQMRNNVKQFVRLNLPKDASLWSCFVSGKPVKPAKDKQGKILIPLQKSQILGEALTQFPVEIVYLTKKSKLDLLGKLRLELPELDIPQNELLWSAYLPRKFNYYRFDGDVELIREARFMPMVGRISGQRQIVRPSRGRSRRAESRVSQQVTTGQDFYGQQVQMEEKVFEDVKKARIQGVLPIKIDVPESGRLYRFSKLLVTDESPWMSTMYIRTPRWLGVLILIIIVIPVIFLSVRKLLRI